MPNAKIRIATSQPGLKEKIKTHLDGNTEVIYWYIRFNIPLDETTVSDRTMDVTDTDGYIMRTDITYNQGKNMIVISPLDTYEQNRFYLLNITKKVRSARGQHLRSTIHILFKLLDNQISDYRVLKKDEPIPKPRPRPADYDKRQERRQINTLEKVHSQRRHTERLAPVGFSVNLWPGLLGLVLVLAALVVGYLWMLLGALALCMAGLVHLFFQLRDKKLASKLSFNRGVRLFNDRQYGKAEVAFLKALEADPQNTAAKNALYKARLYNDTAS